MKREPSSKSFPVNAEEIEAVVAAAPERVDDPECPYDTSDSAAVEAFWKNATLRRPGERGPGRKAKKILLSVRYSSEVVEHFRSTGEGWQTRMDKALKEWVAAHPTDSHDPVWRSRTTAAHNVYSRYRESILNHVFVGQLLRSLWVRNLTEVEVLRPEVDAAGYDLVIECRNQLRHIQLKSSFLSAKTQSVTVNARLASKIAGCVIWVFFDQDSLEPKVFHWLGAGPGEPVPDLGVYPPAKQTRANSSGIKAKRLQFRSVPKRKFEKLDSMDEVIERLFKM
jgi:uncharacterized protein (DUF4415 family)